MDRLKELVRYWMLLIELYTGLYMMEPTEKIFVSTLLLFIFGIIFYWAWSFLQNPLFFVIHVATESRTKNLETMLV